MSTYFVQGSTMDAIADAINAKTGGSSAMTPAQMVTAIGTISSGGSLPTVISAIDGGSFTMASDTSLDGYSINHNLGVIPKGCVVWAEDEISETVSIRYSSGWGLMKCNVINSNNTELVYNAFYSALYNGNQSGQVAGLTDPPIANYLTSNSIRYNSGIINYKASCQYKWLAWA